MLAVQKGPEHVQAGCPALLRGELGGADVAPLQGCHKGPAIVRGGCYPALSIGAGRGSKGMHEVQPPAPHTGQQVAVIPATAGRCEALARGWTYVTARHRRAGGLQDCRASACRCWEQGHKQCVSIHACPSLHRGNKQGYQPRLCSHGKMRAQSMTRQEQQGSTLAVGHSSQYGGLEARVLRQTE